MFDISNNINDDGDLATHRERSRQLAASTGMSALLDTFGISGKRLAEIEEICIKITMKNGNPVKTVKELSETFEGKDLAYVMFRYGTNVGIAFIKVFGKDMQSPSEW